MSDEGSFVSHEDSPACDEGSLECDEASAACDEGSVECHLASPECDEGRPACVGDGPSSLSLGAALEMSEVDARSGEP